MQNLKPVNWKNIARRTGTILFEVFLAVALVGIIGVGLLLWRVSIRPLDLNFAKDFIEDSLRSDENGLHAVADQAILHWPTIRGPLLLGLNNARILDENGKTMLFVDAAALGLSPAGLFIGKVQPEALILKQPQLHVMRSADGSVAFGFGAQNIAADHANEQTALVARILEYIADPNDGDRSSVLKTLRRFEIENAQVMVEDDIANVTWSIPDFDLVFQNARGGLRAAISSAKGNLILPGIYAAPVPFTDLLVESTYDKKNKTLDVSSAQITSKDVTIQALASLSLLDGGVAGPVSMVIDRLPQDRLPALWPEHLGGSIAHEWMTHKIRGGAFTDIGASMNLAMHKGETGWITTAQNLKATFAFEDTTVEYLHNLPPAEQVSGQGTFENNDEKLNVVIEKGMLNGLTVKSANLEFVDIIKEGAGLADLDINLNGPFSNVLEYVSSERIGFHHGFDTDKVKGTADFALNIKFPTLADVKTEDVNIELEGTLKDATLPAVTHGLDLTGGDYTVAIKDGLLKIGGKGALDGRAADITYEQFLDSTGKPHDSKVTAALTGDLPLLQKIGADLSDFVDGSFPLKLDYTAHANKNSDAVITADVTPARLFFEPFAYDKPPGEKGSVSLTAKLKNGEIDEITGLTVNAPNADIKNGQLSFSKGSLTKGKLPNLVVGENNGAIDFDIAASKAMNIVMGGEFLDLRPFLNDDGKNKEKREDTPPRSITVSVKKMRAANGPDLLRNVKLVADIDAEGRFNRLEMDALAGQDSLYLRYKPDESGKRVFHFEAEDAGATLRSFGIYDKIRGGKMVIYGEPIEGIYDRDISGKAEITNFNVVKAPSLARLLGALSLPGMIQTLEGEGVSFAKMEADFNWLYRPQGSLLMLKNGRTSGNALGLTFDGTFDNAANTVDVSGTLIPLSGVNKVIGEIPLVGDILTGGTGSLIAATYKVKGPTENPETTVNPLSVLTPGILRRILFEQ